MNKENDVNSIIDKLGSYQILTNLFPGTFFGVGLSFFFNLEFQTKSIVEDLIIYYFMGFIISRIGSLFVEPILKRFISYVYHPILTSYLLAKTILKLILYQKLIIICVLY